MSGSFGDVGTGTYNRLTINWGDGTVDSQCISPPDLGPICFHVIVVGQPDPLQLGRGSGSYTFDGSHTYASPGSYYGAVTVNDPMGGSKSEPFVVTIKGLAQSINFPAMAAHTFGDAAFGISATGGDSGQPVTLVVTGSQAVCALSGGAAVAPACRSSRPARAPSRQTRRVAGITIRPQPSRRASPSTACR